RAEAALFCSGLSPQVNVICLSVAAECNNCFIADVHIAAPDDPRRLDDQLSQLPELSGRNYHYLWLSQVTEDHHVTWAINTAKQLLPRSGGYRWLVFPRCGRTCEQLKTMVAAMGAAGITVRAQCHHLLPGRPHSTGATRAPGSCQDRLPLLPVRLDM
ncbi:unnamed protein product, partial [Meganyctiphanes norvegica]